MKLRQWRIALGSALLCLAATTPALAETPQGATAVATFNGLKINSGDTAWMLASTALVLLMTPGLALFYGGMVRSKNVLSVLMQSFVACGIITIQWVLYGYSIGFGPDVHGLFGNLDWVGLGHVSAFTGVANNHDPYSTGSTGWYGYATTIPHQVYCMFQLMFAIITPALISGAIVERMKFSAYCLFMLLWATLVYDPLAHWVWGHGGWLGAAGALDFAGGSVVHMSSGFSALVLALVLGRRSRSEGGEELRPHNLPMTVLGTALLWFGWFGFNAGSALVSNQLAVTAFVATQVATGTAAMMWLVLDWIVYKKPSALGFCSGAVAGLVAITPACGYVTPMASIIIGVVVSGVCFWTIKLKNTFHADDALDVFGIHGCGGLVGCLLTGMFATVSVNSTAHNGWFNGGGFVGGMVPQLKDAGSTIFIACVGTFLIAKVVGLITGGLRADNNDEENGLDLADHGEEAYHGDATAIPAYA